MTDTTTLPAGLNLGGGPPPAPSPAGDYAAPAGQPVVDAIPSAPETAAPQPAPTQGERARGSDGRWMSTTQWERDMLGVPAPEQPGTPETLAPIPVPVEQPQPQTQSVAATPDPAFAEQQRQFAEQQAQFEQQRQQFEAQQRDTKLRAEVAQFEQQWQQAEQQTLAQTQNLPVDQVAPTMARFYNAREQAKLQFQNAKLSERAQEQQTRYQEIEQRQQVDQIRSHFPGFAQQEAARLLGAHLTADELSEVVGMADTMGPGAIIPHIQHTIAPRRQMQQQLDQLRRTQTVQQFTDAGVFAVSGGTGQPPGTSRPPKGGWNVEQAAANWYS